RVGVQHPGSRLPRDQQRPHTGSADGRWSRARRRCRGRGREPDRRHPVRVHRSASPLRVSQDSRLLLDVRDLTVRFPTPDGVVQAVSDVSFTLSRGETLGIVGESGSGKSVSNLAIMGLLNRARTVISGEVEFKGRDLLTLPPDELRKVRGKEIAMVFQDPFACLHPMYRVGAQIAEAFSAHSDAGKDAAWSRAVELLDHVGI